MSCIASLVERFDEIADPRMQRTRAHSLTDILALAVLAVIAGAEGWEDIEEFGKQKISWLKKFLDLPSGIPSHDTISRVFQMLRPDAFQNAFMQWIQQLHQEYDFDVISIDGKSLRRSHDRKSMKQMLHSVCAWSTANNMVLGQQAVDAKSNEITAIPKLLEMLEIKGAIVTTDAMGCQKEIASQIVAQSGYYMLQVKGNHPELSEALGALFTELHDGERKELLHRCDRNKNEAHGRQELRMYFQVQLPKSFTDRFSQWQGLTTAVQVHNVTVRDGIETSEVRYYISSLALGVRRAAQAVRNHWQIENTLHWTLDMTFNEDQSRIRKGPGPENFGLLRRFALSIIKQDSSKGSVRKKRKRAAWNDDYLLTLIKQTI